MKILEAAELGRRSVLDFIQILKDDGIYTKEQRKHFISKAIPEWQKIADELESAICAEKYGAVEYNAILTLIQTAYQLGKDSK